VRDKATALAEMHRVLGPAGRLQVADIVLACAVPERSSRSRFGILAL
jgi:ubiquinone/menaquinone biosynthesis C-methylase UbiE